MMREASRWRPLCNGMAPVRPGVSSSPSAKSACCGRRSRLTRSSARWRSERAGEGDLITAASHPAQKMDAAGRITRFDLEGGFAQLGEIEIDGVIGRPRVPNSRDWVADRSPLAMAALQGLLRCPPWGATGIAGILRLRRSALGPSEITRFNGEPHDPS